MIFVTGNFLRHYPLTFLRYSSYKSSKDKPKNSDNGFLDYQEDCLKKEIPDVQEILKDIPKGKIQD